VKGKLSLETYLSLRHEGEALGDRVRAVDDDSPFEIAQRLRSLDDGARRDREDHDLRARRRLRDGKCARPERHEVLHFLRARVSHG
jgi:hypothetical protein